MPRSGTAVNVRRGFEFRPDQLTTRRRTLLIHVIDFGKTVFLPASVREIRECALGVRVETCQFGSTEFAQALEIGQIDFAIGYLPLLDELFLSVNASSHSMVRLPLPHLISYLIRIPTILPGKQSATVILTRRRNLVVSFGSPFHCSRSVSIHAAGRRPANGTRNCASESRAIFQHRLSARSCGQFCDAVSSRSCSSNFTAGLGKIP